MDGCSLDPERVQESQPSRGWENVIDDPGNRVTCPWRARRVVRAKQCARNSLLCRGLLSVVFRKAVVLYFGEGHFFISSFTLIFFIFFIFSFVMFLCCSFICFSFACIFFALPCASESQPGLPSSFSNFFLSHRLVSRVCHLHSTCFWSRHACTVHSARLFVTIFVSALKNPVASTTSLPARLFQSM